MPGLRINHVSVPTRDISASVDFYVGVLGAEPVATPNFGSAVQWLAFGRTQLHLFQSDDRPVTRQHFGVTVDELEPVYRAAERRDVFDTDASQVLALLPGDVVQLYLRDPSGNRVEVDALGADRLPDDIRSQLSPLWERQPQTEAQMAARLFVPE